MMPSTAPSCPRRQRQDDDGVGMITVILVMAVISALGMTAVVLSINNLENSRRDRQALAALATSEAGVAQAISYLRTGSLGNLACIEPAAGTAPGPTCQGALESWSSAANPKQVRLDGTAGACTSSADCYRVWIGTVRPYVANCSNRFLTPPKPCTGLYRIHATGLSGNGPGARQLAVDIEAQPFNFPLGIFAESFSGSGQMVVQQQSLFTTGCVQNRVKDNGGGSGVRFQWDSAAGRPMLDLVYGIPAAAHAEGAISTSNNSCGSASGGGPIHRTSPSPAVRCNPDFPFDQSGDGGGLTSSDACFKRYADKGYPTTSLSGDLQSKYGYRPRGLTDAQYTALRTQADSQGTHNIAPADVKARLIALSAMGVTSPVLFWDNGSVSLGQSDFPDDFSRPLNTNPTCGAKNVTIVVTGAGNNLSYQGGNSAPYLAASIFVPDGLMSGSGGRNTIGTIFAKTIDMSGGNAFYMDECFASNPPGATVDVQVVGWREDDARDVT